MKNTDGFDALGRVYAACEILRYDSNKLMP